MSSRDRKRISHSQNFLRKPVVARKLVDSAAIAPRDTVLEIGAGNGILTREIARRARKVIAVEADSALVEAMCKRTASFQNVLVHNADFFDVPLPETPYRVLANIPYNATSAIIDRLTGTQTPPVDSHLVVQSEAANRYLGQPATTLISVLLFPWFEFEVIHRLRRSDFVPRPRVDSVLLRIDTRAHCLVVPEHRTEYRDFVTFGFTSWAPDVRVAYSHVFNGSVRREIDAVDIDLMRRPSALGREEWLTLFEVYIRSSPVARRRRVWGAYQRLKAQQATLQKSHRTRSRG